MLICNEMFFIKKLSFIDTNTFWVKHLVFKVIFGLYKLKLCIYYIKLI
jgi:hypothetical protein